MLRTLTTSLALFALLLLASCAGFPGLGEQLQAGATTVVRTVDANSDGMLTNSELKRAPQDVNLWLAGLGLLGALFGGGAKLSQMRTQNQVDQLYDATHAPIAQPKA